jgi:hypothetical protein
MKFQVKNGEFQKELASVMVCARTGGKSEYPDVGLITIKSTSSELMRMANNGNVAMFNNGVTPDLEYQSFKDGSFTVVANDLEPTLMSFARGDTLTFESDGNSVRITTSADDEEVQILPVHKGDVTMPELAVTFGKTVRIRRAVFQRAMDKILYAVGSEKWRPEFHYWMLRLAPKHMRAVAGDGTRFAVYEIDGENTVEADGDINVVIHRDHKDVLQKIVSATSADWLIMQEYARKGDGDSLGNQTVVTIDDLKMVLIGHDPRVKWPNESRYLDRKNVMKAVLSSSEWELDLKGILATNNDDIRKNNQVHYTTLTFDIDKKVVNAVTEHTMQSKRRFRLEDIQGEAQTYKCASIYLKEMMQYAEGGNVQIELVDEKSPAIARCYAGDVVQDTPLERVNSTAQTKEQYTMFFVPFIKKA